MVAPAPEPFPSVAALLSDRTAQRLVEDLLASGVGPHDRLPSERRLVERYGVSRVTLRAALGRLAERGVVRASASRGWFGGEALVAPSSTGTDRDPGADAGSVQGFADAAAEHGLPVRARVLQQRVRPCTVDEARRLRVAPGADLFELRRLRSLDGLVVVLEHNRLPLAVCPALASTDFARASLYATLRSADPPQVPRTADYSVEARHATAQETELLEMQDAVPVLVAEQLTRTDGGRPVELTVAAYRGDRYRFTATITNAPPPTTGP